jgi:hypothetical protein
MIHLDIEPAPGNDHTYIKPCLIEKGLITIAIGKKYISQAKFLAYSCMLHIPCLIRSVITDKPQLLSAFYDITIPYNPEYGDPFATKTRLHLYTPFQKTLFVDADSLIINDIDAYWDALRERSFAYNGTKINSGFWYLNVSKLINRIGVSWIPEFNSGMFLFNRTEKVKNIFETAYNFLKNFNDEDIGFFRKKMLPDEPFFAMALAQFHEEPYKDYGRFSRTLIGAKRIHLNTTRGIAWYFKDDRPVFPLVVHFCGRFGRFIYLFEKVRLFFYFSSPIRRILFFLLSGIRNIIKGRNNGKRIRNS